MKTQNIIFEIEEAKMNIQEQKVSHLLHLILSLCTFGFWVVIWLIITVSASVERNRLKRKIKKLSQVIIKTPV